MNEVDLNDLHTILYKIIKLTSSFKPGFYGSESSCSIGCFRRRGHTCGVIIIRIIRHWKAFFKRVDMLSRNVRDSVTKYNSLIKAIFYKINMIFT